MDSHAGTAGLSVIEFLGDRQAGVSALRRDGRRALTREERQWLERVPAAPVVEFGGARARWVRAFFCGWVRHGLEAGKASVEIGPDGSMTAHMPAGAHRLVNDAPDDQQAGAPAPPRTPPTSGARGNLDRWKAND